MSLLKYLHGFYPLSPVSVLISIVEILILAFISYQLILLIRGTRAENIAKGLILLLAVYWLTKILHLDILHWILNKVVIIVFIALPIIFQPELRRALERVGRGSFFSQGFFSLSKEERKSIIRTIANVAFELKKVGFGALIIIEGKMDVKSFVEGGIEIDAKITPELLFSIFTPPTPLHDGATIIKGDKIILSKCFLPLSDNPDLPKTLGSRHRAALGISEVCDCLTIVVSEETQKVSVTRAGKLREITSRDDLESVLLTWV